MFCADSRFRPPGGNVNEEGSTVMTDALQQLIEAARHLPFREDEREAQRRSFAYGNTHIENERITREMVDEQAEVLKSGPVSR
jgi:hypothetical protein